MKKKLTYKDAGVDIKKNDMLCKMLSLGQKSLNFENFAGLYETPFLPEYYLAGTSDGIGTKIIPLLQKNMLKTIAVDLIAMNLNDLACIGASPLFFLDYIAAHSIDVDKMAQFIKVLESELLKYNTVLIGGETSEMPDFIKKDLFDVAGFAAGIVRKDKIIGKNRVKKGNILIALKSSGPHSNGFSLIRKLHENSIIDEKTFENTLQPTVVYINEILKLVELNIINAASNITGGGIESNLKRIIPDGLCANIYKNNIPKTPVFEILKDATGEDEAYRVFNMGAGFIIALDKENIECAMDILRIHNPFIIGEIDDNKSKESASVCLR